MKTSTKLAIAGSIVLAVALWTGPMTSAVAAQGAPAAPSSSEYKIGVVNMEEVLGKYTKLKAQLDALDADKAKLQKDLDDKSDVLSKKMEAFKDASEAEQERQRDGINAELRNLKADFQRMQGDLTDKMNKIRFQTKQDVVKTIQQIGSDENYHLILEGNAAVIYYATAVDITPKVIEKLNAASPAAAAPTKK